jgi:uncharacterized damage-inducible protein DinB
MKTTDLLLDAFGRITEEVGDTVEGLSEEQLAFRPGTGANSIAWLVWHLTRVQDNHVAEAAGEPEVWLEDGWADRFGLSLDPADTGYGHSVDDVAKVRASAELLTGYADAVGERSRRYLSSLDDEALDRVVDERWDPPVTLGVRLVSVIGDDMAHLGQAQYVRGLQQRA